MAARRVLIVMLVLLGVSTLAAALVPGRPGGVDSTGSTAASETAAETTAPPDTVPVGKSLRLSLDVGSGPIKVVPMQVGDQLQLVVHSSKAGELEIPALGMIEAVAPELPARFEIFAREPGAYGIRYVDSGRVVARIQVEQPAKPDPGTTGKSGS